MTRNRSVATAGTSTLTGWTFDLLAAAQLAIFGIHHTGTRQVRCTKVANNDGKMKKSMALCMYTTFAIQRRKRRISAASGMAVKMCNEPQRRTRVAPHIVSRRMFAQRDPSSLRLIQHARRVGVRRWPLARTRPTSLNVHYFFFVFFSLLHPPLPHPYMQAIGTGRIAHRK